MIQRFNIRVYGILEQKGKVLLLRERYKEMRFVKFPGGGLEYGEGPVDCLKREFKEELDLELHRWDHFYTTEHYQQSVFDPKDQIVSIYFKVEARDLSVLRLLDDPEARVQPEQILWGALEHDDRDLLTFPIDKIVWDKLNR